MSTVQTQSCFITADSREYGRSHRSVPARGYGLVSGNNLSATHRRHGLLRRLFLISVALFADFLANDKPYYLRIGEQTYFPIFRSYLVSAGLAHWPAELLNVDFKKLDGAQSRFFRPFHIGRPTSICSEPLRASFAKALAWHGQLGRDVMAGMIHGSRVSLSIGFVAVGIAVIIGLVLGAIAGYFAVGWTW